MTALIPPALEDLQEALPLWWNSESGELANLLAVWGQGLDEVAALIEQRDDDIALDTATDEALYRTFAYAWGMEFETLGAQRDVLRAMIVARAQETGSVNSLLASLMSLLLTPTNVGVPLLLPLTFPASGGLTLGGAGATVGEGYFIFPGDGSGLHFPVFPEVQGKTWEGTVTRTGQVPPGAGPGLFFPENAWVAIDEDPTNYAFTVRVKTWLTFDRAAFARTVERFRLAHLAPPTIIEENQ